MALGETMLVCEGEPEGRDIRWLGLALAAAGLESRIDLVPGGSKANLKPTVLGLRRTLRTIRVYAVRDRDFLTSELLTKDLAAGICPLPRHCIESYLVEPDLLEAAAGLQGARGWLEAKAERRLFLDIARAALDDFAFSLRRLRPSLAAADTPASKEEAIHTVRAKLDGFSGGLPLPDVASFVDRLERDMRSGNFICTRVDGKALLGELEAELRTTAMPGGDLEGRLFKWCSQDRPPAALVDDLKHVLRTLGATD